MGKESVVKYIWLVKAENSDGGSDCQFWNVAAFSSLEKARDLLERILCSIKKYSKDADDITIVSQNKDSFSVKWSLFRQLSRQLIQQAICGFDPEGHFNVFDGYLDYSIQQIELKD